MWRGRDQGVGVSQCGGAWSSGVQGAGYGAQGQRGAGSKEKGQWGAGSSVEQGPVQCQWQAMMIDHALVCHAHVRGPPHWYSAAGVVCCWCSVLLV